MNARKWFENVWYHYKWVIIGSIFAMIVVVIAVTQIARQEKSDIRMVYCGPAVLSEDQANSVCKTFSQIMSKDYDGDGKKNVRVNTLTVLSDEQLAEKERLAREEDDFILYDPTTRNEVRTQLVSLLGSGEVIICLIDDYLYEELYGQNAFVPLEEVLGYKPGYAEDECSVRIGDTELWQYFTELQVIPADTRLCMRRMSVTALVGNKETSEKIYDYHRNMLCDMFEFKSPSGITG